MGQYNGIVFDLDGTLVDSVNGIELSFKYAFYKTYGKELKQSIKSLIGPPIDQVLIELNGENNEVTINKFIDYFKQHYDIIGFKESLLFLNVIQTLKDLKKSGIKLFIATNKRFIPTRKILDWLNIDEYFVAVYCSDFPALTFSSKTQMLEKLIIDHNLNRVKILMVGDTIHDSVAADNNNINFVYVDYGYGICQNPMFSLNNIIDIFNILQKK